MLKQARAYNKSLLKRGDGDVLEYPKQLAVSQDGAMASLEIKKIGVNLPVFHGTADEALMNGVGHLEGSSLPVGGKGTRCVLMAHSGMRNARMFDELYKLEEGDTFTIRTLNEELSYEVYETEVVKPEEVEDLVRIKKGEDLVTLITCTPYGVNSDRLLVHAKRRAPTPEPERVEVGVYVNDRSTPLVAAAALLGCSALGGLIGKVRARVSRKGGHGRR